MGRAFGGLAKRVYVAFASPYALLVALALDADRSKIGIEDRSPREIDSVRDATRAQGGRARVG